MLFVSSVAYADHIKDSSKQEVFDAFKSMYADRCQDMNPQTCFKTMKAEYIQQVVNGYRFNEARKKMNVSQDSVISWSDISKMEDSN